MSLVGSPQQTTAHAAQGRLLRQRMALTMRNGVQDPICNEAGRAAVTDSEKIVQPSPVGLK